MAPIVRYLTSAALAAVTGCTFETPAPSIPTIEPSPTPPAPQPCGTSEQGVALCVDFEDRPLAGLAVDLSLNKNNAIAVAVGTTSRPPSSQAALLEPTSSLLVPESSTLDLARFTIEMWIRPDQVTKTKDHDVGLFDNYNQYTMRLQEDRRILCGLTGDHRVSSGESVPSGTWSHVACSYADGQMRVYLNGQLSACKDVGIIEALGRLGSAIGSEIRDVALTPVPADRFLGGIDNVRIYNQPLADDRICTAAGWPSGSCVDVCPGSDSGSGSGSED